MYCQLEPKVDGLNQRLVKLRTLHLADAVEDSYFGRGGYNLLIQVLEQTCSPVFSVTPCYSICLISINFSLASCKILTFYGYLQTLFYRKRSALYMYIPPTLYYYVSMNLI